MKKIIYILLIIIFSSSICLYAKPAPHQQGRPPAQHRGFHRGHFGLSEEQYNKLNLSKTQKSKVEAIEKKYSPQTNQKPDFAQMRNKAAAKNKEFRAILTDQQKKLYDKYIAEQKKKSKDMMSAYYKGIAKELKFSQAQTNKLNNMLKNSSGNPMETEKKFLSILTQEQKKNYEKKKQNMMHNFTKQKHQKK